MIAFKLSIGFHDLRRTESLAKALHPPIEVNSVLSTSIDVMYSMEHLVDVTGLNCNRLYIPWTEADLVKVKRAHQV